MGHTVICCTQVETAVMHLKLQKLQDVHEVFQNHSLVFIIKEGFRFEHEILMIFIQKGRSHL